MNTETYKSFTILDEKQLNTQRILEKIEKVMFEKKRLVPNIDFTIVNILNTLGIPIELSFAMFIFFRIPGLVSHIYEQDSYPFKNLIINPNEYNGPLDLKFIDIKERSKMRPKF